MWQINGDILKERGIVDEQSDITDEDSYVEAITRDYAEPYRKSFVEQLPKHIQEEIEAYEKGVDIDSFRELHVAQLQLEKLKDEDIDKDIELQRRLLKEDLKDRGFDDDEIKDMIETYEDKGTLKDKSKKVYKDKIAKLSELKKQKIKEAEENNRKAEENYKEWKQSQFNMVNKIKELWGVKLSPEDKTELKKMLTSNSVKLKDGRHVSALEAAIIKDPSILAKINYALLKGMFNDKSKFISNDKAKTQETNRIMNLLDTESNKKKIRKTSGDNVKVHEDDEVEEDTSASRLTDVYFGGLRRKR